jgi:hypothetical protein
LATASARPHHRRLPDRDHARPARRAEPARLPLSLVDARDPARQDRRDQAADQDPAAMVRQAQVIAAILKEVMTNEAIGAGRHRRVQQGRRRRHGLAGAGRRLCRHGLCHRDVTVWDADPRIADEKLRLVEKVIQGRDFTACPRRQCRRCLARLAARPCLRQCPAAADLDAQSRPHDPAVGGVGGAGTGRAFRRAPLALRQDRRLDPVPVFPSCRRCRPHADRRPDRRGQVRAAGADGAAVPPLRRKPRSSPSTSAARSAPPRSPWAATGTISAAG